MIADFKLEQPTRVVSQAASFVRELISSGQLQDGQRLPSTAALSKSWGVRVGCVHAALAELVQDGLLVRQPGRGTFVSRSKPALTVVAIYEMADRLANPESNIHRVILAELQRQLTEDGIQVQAVIDPRRDEAQAEPWEPLVSLSREHRVGATIAASTTHHSLPWLSRLPHLAAFARIDQIAGRVETDFNQMTDLCLGALAEQGCRSVGLLSAMPDDAKLANSRRHPLAAFYGHFTECAAALGLEVRDEWTIKVEHHRMLDVTFQKLGYDRFRTLWQRPARPEGLMIYPDSFIPGVVLAMTELGVRVPGDLRLAYHRNEQTPILSPFPATEAILSEREIAAALIAQAKRLWRGDPCEPVHVGFRREDTK